MLDYLHEVEKRLPELLKTPGIWNSKLVLYEKPTVERLWLQDGENRIYLHCIYPLKKDKGECAFLHSHPWPSAIKILRGSYEMEIGVEGSATSKMLLRKGSEYEMLDPRLIHSVTPAGGIPSHSLMVTGPTYPLSALVFKGPLSGKSVVENPNLSPEAIEELFDEFISIYTLGTL